MIQFYSNNATNLHQLTTYSTTVLLHKMAIVFATSLHPMYKFAAKSESAKRSDDDGSVHCIQNILCLSFSATLYDLHCQ